MATPEASFVIPSYRSLRTLGFTLRSAWSQVDAPSFEVIVVDSSETEISGWVRARFPRTTVIQNPGRLLPGAARNLGAGESRGRLIAFLDADAIADSCWLSALCRRLEADSELAAVGGYVGNANPATLPSRVQHWLEFSEFVPGTPAGYRDFLPTCNLLMRREVFRTTGGFEPAWAMAEDLLFCSALAGRLWFEGTAGVRHHHRSRWGQVLPHLSQLGWWSGRFRRHRNLPTSFLVRVPLAAYLLPAIRIPRILSRLVRADRREALRAAAGLPGLLIGAAAWAHGFSRGLEDTLTTAEARRRKGTMNPGREERRNGDRGES